LTWGHAISIGTISGLGTYFLFLFLEIIWGDMLKDVLISGMEQAEYFNINLILLIGLAFVFFISFLTNILILGNYTLGSRLLSNFFAIIYTIIILFFISWLSIIIIYKEQYSQLDLISQINLSTHFYCIFAVYVLSDPTMFWIIAIMIYHVIFIILIKLFLIKKRGFNA